MCELSHLPSLLAAVPLIWVARDIRSPPDTASWISPALQQPCQGKMQHSTKDYGITAFDESATGILLDVTQHNRFASSSPFIMLCQDWSRDPGSSWSCSLPVQPAAGHTAIPKMSGKHFAVWPHRHCDTIFPKVCSSRCHQLLSQMTKSKGISCTPRFLRGSLLKIEFQTKALK